jgi:Zn-finger nucleic acid-binding protein
VTPINGRIVSMNCPKCKKDTLNAFGMIEGVHVDFCSGCKGIWFDKGELAFYTEMPVDIPSIDKAMASGRSTGLACPVCQNQELVEVHYLPGEHPLIDVCRGCKGVFVDRGELPMIEKSTTRLRGIEVLGQVTKQLEDRGYQILGVHKK